MAKVLLAGGGVGEAFWTKALQTVALNKKGMVCSRNQEGQRLQRMGARRKEQNSCENTIF